MVFSGLSKKKASFPLSVSCAARGGRVTCLVREMSPEVCCGCPGQLLFSLWKGEPAEEWGGVLSFPLLPFSFFFYGVHGGAAGFPGGSDGKQSAYNAGDLGSIPRSGRSPAEGNGSPLQCSCLENPMDRRSLVGYSPWGRKESDMTSGLTARTWWGCAWGCAWQPRGTLVWRSTAESERE